MSASEIHSEVQQSPQTVDENPQNRIARYDQFFDPHSRTNVYRKTNKQSEDKRSKRLAQKKVAILARRHFNNKGQLIVTVVEIRSPILLEVLLEIHKDDDSHHLTSTPATCDNELLYHSFEDLNARLRKETTSVLFPNTNLISDIGVMLTYIQEEFGNVLAETRTLFNADVPSVSFNLLWTLFPAGELVYHRHSGTEQDKILKARAFEIARDIESGEKYGALACTGISNDGRIFGLSSVIIRLPRFDGNQVITGLSAFPLKFHPNRNEIHLSCIKRGKKYANLTDQNYVEISGQAIRMDSTPTGDKVIEAFSVNGRVMIDPTAYRMFEPQSNIPQEVYQSISISNMTDDDYAMCDPVVLGFSFEHKLWGGFPLDHVREIEWSEEAFNHLVIDQHIKTTIKSLITQHASGTISFDDIVKGKGKGLVGLLAGGPGCGKTLTAEAVAAISKRPLYNVSAGELGTTPVHVDDYLQRILSLGQRWNAVVLLDEADVFMSKRSVTDINRNALVSIFLRQLEYYQGILILTTNRARDCDIAFESRIHFTICYPDLSPASRKEIWKTFLAKTGTRNTINEKNLNHLKKWTLNGRQIKNIVSVANTCCLANNDPVITFKDIENAMNATGGWRKSRELGWPESDDNSSTMLYTAIGSLAIVGISLIIYVYQLDIGFRFFPVIIR